MIEMFKMVSGPYDEVIPAVVTAEEGSYKTRGHNYKLPRNHNKNWLRQQYFKERIACPWNCLPDKVVEATSKQSFEKRLDKHCDWRDQDLVFNYEAALTLCYIANYKHTCINFCSKSDDDMDTQD